MGAFPTRIILSALTNESSLWRKTFVAHACALYIFHDEASKANLNGVPAFATGGSWKVTTYDQL